MHCAVPVYNTVTIITGREQTPELGSTVIPLPYPIPPVQPAQHLETPANQSLSFFFPPKCKFIYDSSLHFFLPQQILDQHHPSSKKEKRKRKEKK